MCQLAGPAAALGQWRQVLPGAGGPGPEPPTKWSFLKVKEKGPEQPYTKYSIASSKGCTEFLALRSTECVSLLRVPLQPPSSPQQGRGVRFKLPSRHPQPGESSEEGLGAGFFVPCSFLSPFEGWARPFFAEFQLSKAPPQPCHLSALESISSPVCGKAVSSSTGGYGEGIQVVFLPILSVSFPEKKNHIPVPIRGIFTFFDINQKPKRLTRPFPPTLCPL